MASRLLAVSVLAVGLGHAEGFIAGSQSPLGAYLRSARPARAPQRMAPVMAKMGKRPTPAKASVMPFSRKNTEDARDLSEALGLGEISMSDDRKEEVEKCLERYNAVYTMVWKRCSDTGSYRVVGHYTTDARKRCAR
jgi:hypothetical protein